MRRTSEAPGAAILGFMELILMLSVIGFVVVTDIPRLVANVKRFMVPNIRRRFKRRAGRRRRTKNKHEGIEETCVDELGAMED